MQKMWRRLVNNFKSYQTECGLKILFKKSEAERFVSEQWIPFDEGSCDELLFFLIWLKLRKHYFLFEKVWLDILNLNKTQT